MRIRAASIGVVLLLVLAAGCDAPAPPTGEPPNVVVVVIDTLRADRVGWMRDGDSLTPFLDDLARRGAVLPNAFAQAPETRPSVASLLTSRHPLQHGVRTLQSVLPERERTLAEVLRDHGWATAGFSANPSLLPNQGFGQGFERFEVPDFYGPKDTKQRAGDLNQRALAWLDALGERRPFFLYLQYMEPHNPYTVPAGELELLLAERGRPEPDRERARWLLVPKNSEQIHLTFDFARFDRALLGPMQDVYDAEVRDLDQNLAALFTELERRGLLRNTVVVVTADHGEEFLEHLRIGHGGDLHEQTVRIPLAIVGPGVRPGQRLDTVVSHLDLAPTVLALAGLDPETTFEGRSIAPALRTRWWVARLRALFGGTPDEPPPAALLVQPQEKMWGGFDLHERGLVVGTDKVVLRRDGEVLAFDLAADAGEQRADGLEAARRDALVARLRAEEQNLAGRAGPHITGTLERQQVEGLRALGYLAD